MKLIFLFASAFYLFCSCSNKENDYFTKESLVEYISNEDPRTSSNLPLVFLFCKSNDADRLGFIDNYGLQKHFLTTDSSLNYKVYIQDIFNYKIKIDCQSLNECFNLNDTITDSYENNQLDNFLAKYSKKVIKNVYSINTELSYNAKLTVSYYLFLNDYFTQFDDISGLYYVEKLKVSSIQKTTDGIYIER